MRRQQGLIRILIIIAAAGLTACMVEEPAAPALSTDIPTQGPTDTPTLTPTVTPTPGPTLTVTPVLNLSAIPPTGAATETPLAALGYIQIGANSQWAPISRVFDGVEMLLVPTGCFMMGSDGGEDDEVPVHQICFDRPFWIDRTEVTNAQYGSESELSSGPNRPRDTVTLPEAMAHCASRSARLPTEAEWEYAARGPDGWSFPWGNMFEPDKVVYESNSGGRSAEVGSRPEGASWVGALDMAGNLWEWTTTIYAYSYPYDPADGRENDEDMSVPRSIRGGSYSNGEISLRGANRKSKHPTDEWEGYMGFRCVRDE